MPRRLLVPNLHPGRLPLPIDQAHHARDVLRLPEGEIVELFTADGRTARATLCTVNHEIVVAMVDEIAAASPAPQLTIASAVAKGARADWMIEKLSELGVARFIPLQTERSVVHPEGKGKLDRWQRLAEESAKQSHRAGVMQISPLITLHKLLSTLDPTSTAYLSTAPGALPIAHWLSAPSPSSTPGAAAKPADLSVGLTPNLCLLIGPEGGWSASELSHFETRRLTPLTLGATILRIETAAIAAAAIVSACSPS